MLTAVLRKEMPENACKEQWLHRCNFQVKILCPGAGSRLAISIYGPFAGHHAFATPQAHALSDDLAQARTGVKNL
jgi:hypothetical protein